MSERLNEVLDRIEGQLQSDEVAVGDNASPLDFLTAVYRDPRQPISRRMRAAIEAAPYYHPKLSATAVLHDADTFASRLERAITRSGKAPLMIEAKPVEASED